MTTLESAKMIGTTMYRSFNGLKVKVKILDVKNSYGVERYLVTVDGQKDSNQIWINA